MKQEACRTRPVSAATGRVASLRAAFQRVDSQGFLSGVTVSDKSIQNDAELEYILP